MDNLLLYLLKVSAGITLLYLCYLLFFRKDTFYRRNRIFLILTLLLPTVFPVLKIPVLSDAVTPAAPVIAMENTVFSESAYETTISGTINSFDYNGLFIWIYFTIAGILLLRIVVSLLSTYRIIKKGTVKNGQLPRIIISGDQLPPFSFFPYAVIPVEEYLSENYTDILDHEAAHIRQGHTFDLVLSELFIAFQWFNPFVWFIKRSIALNHEYLADNISLRNKSVKDYQYMLLHFQTELRNIFMAHSFNSLIKNRIIMINKKPTGKYAMLKNILILPVVLFAVYSFATPDYRYVASTNDTSIISDTSVIIGRTVKGIVLNEESKPMSGVFITASGTSTGVTTDQNGYFAMTTASDGSPLIFTYRGYRTLNADPDRSKAMTIRMVKDPDLIPPDVKIVPPLKTQQGQTGPLKPLIIIDGVESERGIAGIDPNSISTISVLKDSSSVALYGEKGKNGVMIVTLKREVSLTQTAQASSQNTVKGIVMKEDGKPLEGVNITSTGTMGNASGATTGSDGLFEITNVRADASLLFYCKGYKRVTLKAEFNKRMTVKMEKDPEFKAAQRPEPLVVVDGVIVEKSVNEVIKELGYDFGILKALSLKDAGEKYGDIGKNGAVEITTRKKAIEMGLKPPFPRLKPEDYPTFEGKTRSVFNDWVLGRLKYPPEATSRGIQGIVNINFSVELDGSITNIKAMGTPDPVLADAVVNVIKSSPKWDPPKNKLVDAPFQYFAYVRFTLPDKISDDVPFVVVEQMPEYPGGDVGLLNFIRKNLKYPEEAKSKKIEGRVIIRFVVNREGNVEDVNVLKGVDPLLDAEAVRVVRTLSGWKPGMQGGKAVSVYYMVPVTFSLSVPEPLFSDASEKEILKFLAMNTGYPAQAKESADIGKVFVAVKMDKGGIIKECKAFTQKSDISVPILPEIVIVGYKTPAGPGDLRAGKTSGDGQIALQTECVRVANKLAEIAIPEWKEKNMEFALVFNFVLK